MRSTLFALVIAVICPLLSAAQPDISSIDRSVQDIKNRMPSFTKVEKIHTKEGSRIIFLQGKDVQLITVKTIEQSIEKKVEWYYIKGELAYSETNWIDTRSKNKVFHEKCYLYKQHLISRAGSGSEPADPSSEEFKKTDAALTAYGASIRNEALK